MSGSKAESDIEEEDQDNETPLENENTLVLFGMKGSKKPEYWTFIKLIAPNDSKKKWKTSECLGVYCTKCKLQL